MKQAICLMEWKSDDFGFKRGFAVVLDMNGENDFRLYKYGPKSKGPENVCFVTQKQAGRAFENAVRACA